MTFRQFIWLQTMVDGRLRRADLSRFSGIAADGPYYGEFRELIAHGLVAHVPFSSWFSLTERGKIACAIQAGKYASAARERVAA